MMRLRRSLDNTTISWLHLKAVSAMCSTILGRTAQSNCQDVLSIRPFDRFRKGRVYRGSLDCSWEKPSEAVCCNEGHV